VAFVCIELMFKMLDYSRQQRRPLAGFDPFVDYLRFLIPFPVLSVNFCQWERRLPADHPWKPEIIRALLGAGLFATGFFLVEFASEIRAIRSCFLLDHAIKLMIFAVTIEALSTMLYGIERLASFETTSVIHNACLSRTVAEFWCRYNTRVHTWFDRNVFRRVGGRRAPVRGVLVTFFLSGLLHELGFGIATSRFDGYQFAFFMLQAPAVLVSRPLHRLATPTGIVGSVFSRFITIAWMFFTSMFFFHGVNRVFPFFYASEPWLP